MNERIPICPACASWQIQELGKAQWLISGGDMRSPVKYTCRDCGWYGNMPGYDGDGLLTLPCYCHAAIVVEYNLFIWNTMRDNPDMMNGETEARYLNRLMPAHLEPDTKLAKDLPRKARQWSEYYK